MSKRGLGKGLDALLATSSLAREKQQVASHSHFFMHFNQRVYADLRAGRFSLLVLFSFVLAFS